MKKYSVIDCFWGDYAQVAITVKKKMKWGLIDRSGEEIIPAIYDSIQYVGGEVAFVNIGFREGQKYEYSGKWGVINLRNEIVVPFSYSGVIPWNNRAIVCRRNKWGVVDYAGNIIIPLKYDSLFSSERDDTYIFEIQERFGLIDKSGDILIPPKYDQIRIYNRFDYQEWFAVCKDNKWFYIKRNGDVVLL